MLVGSSGLELDIHNLRKVLLQIACSGSSSLLLIWLWFHRARACWLAEVCFQSELFRSQCSSLEVEIQTAEALIFHQICATEFKLRWLSESSEANHELPRKVFAVR